MARKKKYKVSSSPRRSETKKSSVRSTRPRPTTPTGGQQPAATTAVAADRLAPLPTKEASAPVKTDVGATLVGRSGVELTNQPESDYTYNWPYDFFSLIELVRLDAAIEYDTE